ncbi:MAG: LysR family transcriptional regulator, partial [Litoreibacter sp.]|nr:LysR family transcriptional regulator [Litoreibacter sp.]
MNQLNYHHLRYFREVATLGHLSQAADRLNVSQSALSIQIKQLEERLGHALFDRVGRRLELTEAGRIALDHADRIFGAGVELIAALNQDAAHQTPLRVGALSTLSRNFQLQFLRPLLSDTAASVVLRSARSQTLLDELETLTLDVVLTTELPQSDTAFAAQKLAEQPVGLHGTPERVSAKSLKGLLETQPLILPTESVIRAGFENICAKLEITPRIAAEVDDMAMVRLLAREGVGLAVAP